MPTCFHCKIEKSRDQFYNDKSRPDGHKPRCKKCDNIGRDKENRSVYEKKYWDKQREHRRLIVLKSFNKNKDHHAEKRKEYLKTEKGMISYKKYTQKRYALKKTSCLEHIDIKQLFDENGGFCEYCKKPLLFSDIHVDHFIPLSKGGEHKKSNLRISCAKCNKSKGSKMPSEWEVRYQMVQA